MFYLQLYSSKNTWKVWGKLLCKKMSLHMKSDSYSMSVNNWYSITIKRIEEECLLSPLGFNAGIIKPKSRKLYQNPSTLISAFRGLDSFWQFNIIMGFLTSFWWVFDTITSKRVLWQSKIKPYRWCDVLWASGWSNPMSVPWMDEYEMLPVNCRKICWAHRQISLYTSWWGTVYPWIICE